MVSSFPEEHLLLGWKEWPGLRQSWSQVGSLQGFLLELGCRSLMQHPSTCTLGFEHCRNTMHKNGEMRNKGKKEK